MAAAPPLGFLFHDGGRAMSGRRGRAGDCVTRATALLVGWLEGDPVVAANDDRWDVAAADRWGDRYDQLYRAMAAGMKAVAGVRSARNGTSPKAYEPVWRELGIVRQPLPGVKPTYAQALAEFGPGIGRKRGHIFALLDGRLVDTYDHRQYQWCAIHGGHADESGFCQRGEDYCSDVAVRERKVLGYFTWQDGGAA